MTRLDDVFSHLADRGEPRGPDQVLGAARERAAALRRRRLAAMGGVAAAAVVLVAALGLLTLGGDDGTRVESGLAATTAAPITEPDPTTTVATDGPVVVEVHLLSDTAASCTATRAVERTVRGPAVLRKALDELLRGPTEDEQAAGLWSAFSAATAGGVRSVDVVDGVARVDLRGDLPTVLPAASTSCASGALLAQLDATATQFDGVERAVYSLDGDVAAFYGWLEMVAPDDSSSTPEDDGVPG